VLVSTIALGEKAEHSIGSDIHIIYRYHRHHHRHHRRRHHNQYHDNTDIHTHTQVGKKT
jgi:hypothetical protein